MESVSAFVSQLQAAAASGSERGATENRLRAQIVSRLHDPQWPKPPARTKVTKRLKGRDLFQSPFVTALTWALEVGDPHRFPSIADAVSYRGLTAAFRSSADKQQRGPISKQRNAWLQTILIEAAKVAPIWNPQLAALHAKELAHTHANRATRQVARKLVAYLLAVDKSGQPFQMRPPVPAKPIVARRKATQQHAA